ncbi:MAG TPA: SusC/RagA family TonB-linked outer membrane protein [Gemmatimonadaceae bacterium]|nr:SusC/RagA family TonB-linked outer membrane protein [Gemmatimonadaceae bacterium]
MKGLWSRRKRPALDRAAPRRLVHVASALAIAIGLQMVAARVARAQEGVVAGRVVASGTNEPLSNAAISVVGGTQRAESDAQGHFRLTGLSGTTVTLDVRRIGYRGDRVSARVGQTDVVVSLAVNPTALEAVVVTGTAGAQEKREIGNAVTTIDAASVAKTAPIPSMQSLLNGRTPGLVVMPTSGAVGTGSQVRVRGIASFSLGNNPLIYVDGVRVDNAAATGPSNQAFGSSTISRLNDMNPDDIQSIEVLKGPSAATLYGTEASNGVINIITKHGAMGTTRWNLTARQGVNYLQNWRTRFPTNYGVVNGQLTTLNMDSLVAANHGDLFQTGKHEETQLAVSGGTNLINYYASGSLLEDQGAEPTNFERHYNGRVNVGITPSPKLRVSAEMGYITGPTNLSAEAGYGGRVWSTLLATPTTYGTWRHGFYSGLPYQYDMVYKMWQDLDRFTANMTFENDPTTWFHHRVTLGLDRVNEGNNYYYPRIDSLNQYSSFSGDALGYRELDQVTTTYRTIDYSANATWNAKPTMRFVTSGGAQYYHDATNSLGAWGSVFPFPGLNSVNATTQGKGQSQDFYDDATLGYYVQEEYAWRERLFLTAAARWDNSSAFGANVNKVVYPKYSLSYVLSDEDYWKNNHWLQNVNSFRFRAAYGEAGKAPGTYDAVRTFSPVSGPGDSPAVTPLSIGNPNLGPERGKEYELGFDAGLWSDRLTYELTRYHKRTTNAILFQQIAPSSGFAGSQPFNAGSILNTGWENSLHFQAYSGENINWDIGANYSTNDNKVESLFPNTPFVTAGTYLRHTVGYPAFGWWSQQLVSAQIDGTGHGIKSSMMCSDGNGGSTPCYDGSGKLIAPVVYLGRSVPPVEGSVNTTLRFFKNFSVYTMVDFANGAKKMDGNTRVRCDFFGGRCPENFASLYGVDKLNPVRTAEVNSNQQFIDFLITKDNFTKWRELTFSYDVPERYAARINSSHATISLSGRNLHTWTGYQGFEPEAMFLGGSRGGNASWEQTTLPQLTSWILTINLGF